MTDPGRKPGVRKIVLASTASLVAALGTTFALTLLQANHTADIAVGDALAAARRAVDAFLAERTRAITAMSRVSAGSRR